MRPMINLAALLALASPCVASPADYEWSPSGTGMVLRKSGRQVGYLEAGKYRPLGSDGRFGDVTDPPVPAPSTIKEGVPSFGVVQSQVPQKESYTVNGKDVRRGQALDILAGKGELTDDSKKLRLTFNIADPAIRQRAVHEWQTNPATQGLRDLVLVQEYAPGEWAVSGVALPQGVVLQAPPDQAGRGKVIWVANDYPGVEKLAEYVRRADPNFKPNQVPNPAAPLLPGLPDLSKIPPWVLAAVGAAAALLFLHREKKV